MRFTLHDIVHAGDVIMRVLRVTPTVVILLKTGDASAWPEVWLYDDALECVRSGAWSLEGGVAPRVMLDREMSETVRRKRDADWAIIERHVEDARIFDPARRGQLIAQIVEEARISPPTARKLLRLYFHEGMCPSALAAGYSRSGAPGVKRNNSRKPGPVPKYGDANGVPVGEEERRAFERSLRATYAKDGRYDLGASYRHYLAHYASVPDPDHVGDLLYIGKYAEHGPPTFRQFEYFCRNNDWEGVQRQRQTDRVYEMKRRPLTGTSTAEALGPCSRFQIDATILRAYVRSRLNRYHIVGRPTLYVVIDTYTRMIVGVDLSFENASWAAAMTALASCVEDKVELCKRYNVTISPEQWPVRHMCGALLGDNGELKKAGLGHFLDASRAHIQNAAAWRADFKGTVERRFGTIETAMGPYTPGFVQPDFMERGARDYRGEAVFDLDDVWANVIDIILHFNNVHSLKGYPLQPHQIEDGVPSVPLELWKWGIANRTGSPRTPDPERFRFSLLPVAEATSTKAGLLFQGRFYVCRDHGLLRSLADRAADGRFKVPISHDTRDVGRIYVHQRSAAPGFVVADLGDASVAHRGGNCWESHGITFRAKQIAAERRPMEDLERAAMERRMEARAARKQAEVDTLSDDRSIAAKVRDIREHRAAERADARIETVARFSPARSERAGDVPTGNAGVGKVVPFRPGGASFSMRALLRARDDAPAATPAEGGTGGLDDE